MVDEQQKQERSAGVTILDSRHNFYLHYEFMIAENDKITFESNLQLPVKLTENYEEKLMRQKYDVFMY